MSASSFVSAQGFYLEQINQVDFSIFLHSTSSIKNEKLKNLAVKTLTEAEAELNAIREKLKNCNYLPDRWFVECLEHTIEQFSKNREPGYENCDFQDRKFFQGMFRDVKKVLKIIKSRSEPEFVKETIQEQTLFEEQESLHNDEMFISRLQTYSKSLSEMYRPRVYIAYAWPLENCQRECKVQTFLKTFAKHLEYLGVKVKLDVKSCIKGKSIYDYMDKKIRKSDTFMLFGTESLLHKMNAHGGVPLTEHHTGRYPLICYELGLAYERKTGGRAKREKVEESFILPVLLTGNMKNSFPSYFQGNINILDLPKRGYLEGVKTLIFTLYKWQAQELERHQQLWEEAFNVCQPQPVNIVDHTEFLKSQNQAKKQDKVRKELNALVENLRDENEKIYRELGLSKDQVCTLSVELEKAHKQIAFLQEKISSKSKISRGLAKEATIIPEIAFGKTDWEAYFGEVGEEPPLPANIEEILKSACPFWPDKQVEETHLLVLVPQTVDGVPLTLNSLSELIKVPKQGNATEFGYYENVQKEYGDKPITSSHWVLLTKDVILNSRNKSYENQRKLIAGNGEYEVPQLIDIVVGIMMHHAKTGERLYSNKPYIYTRCKEALKNGRQTVVGGFSPGGLDIGSYYYDIHSFGVGGSWKF